MLLMTDAAIHLNQIGFRPGDPKQAIVAAPSPEPLPWTLERADGRIVLKGRTSVAGDDAATGDHVHHIAFDAAPAGRYRLKVAGAASQPFPVAPGIYRPLAHAALNFFYHQRAGTPILARWAGEGWARPAGHAPEVAACFSGKDEAGNVWPGCDQPRDVTGGWYDAGDHGKYVVNAGISVWTLQNLYEAGFARPLFADGQARLPEAGNGHDDLLDEARWEVEWMLRMQVPAGTMLALPVGEPASDGRLTLVRRDAGGMAFHKVADRRWTALPMPPADDPEDRLIYPPSTAATLNLAAVAAQAARLWRNADPAFADRCRKAALAAWDAAERHPRILAAQGFTGSGGYGDGQLDDDRAWAAAELFALTGDARFADRLGKGAVEVPNWADTGALGTITLAVADGMPDAIRRDARARIVTAADGFVAEAGQSGYAIPYAGQRYAWGSNSDLLNRAMLLGLAARFTDDAKYRRAALGAMDYVLGRNPLGQSYLTGFGWKPMQNPHHRFWAKSLDASLPPPPPGVVSGGPNNSAMSDDVAKTLKGKCAPQRCWADHIRAYALNEVTINWNAPLVWVAAYLDSDPA
ncbi:glycoside hydrolase family 9 protein [Sphingomonas sp.]|uniref:glycoside hydrolase family 9 protein n=1 Tax=Sphingomonas sp. TaxID=28214 RepID=UPI002BB75F8F|nr:glycoside hydrolase family 9 protein [Sphingomonas sp.]HTG37505.1 glycoside hydrolase family 9 protein [Sphingomonas sp.]